MALLAPADKPYKDKSGTEHPGAYAVLAVHNNRTIRPKRLFAVINIYHDSAAFQAGAEPVAGGIVTYSIEEYPQTEPETGRLLLPGYDDIMGPGPLPPNAETLSIDEMILRRATMFLALDSRWDGWTPVP